MTLMSRVLNMVRRATTEAVEMRNHLCSYFLKPSVALHWQNKYTLK
jgi:hypothetical protein